MAAAMRETWRAIQPQSVASLVVDKWWARIVASYSEPARHYHTAAHIERLLELCTEHKDKIVSMPHMVLTTFFHDIVYDPTQKDNELKSIDVFREYASEVSLDAPLVRDVSSMIEATIRHQVADGAPDTPADLPLFLDFDLEVLSWAHSDYAAYSRNIRAEYIHVPLEQYRTGRAAVLQAFLSRPFLYFTELGRARWEAAARVNVVGEIALLRGGAGQ